MELLFSEAKGNTAMLLKLADISLSHLTVREVLGEKLATNLMMAQVAGVK